LPHAAYLEPLDGGVNSGSWLIALEQDRITFGRRPSYTVALENKLVSAYHAAVERRAEGWVLCPSPDTANGTWVNGVRVDRAPDAPYPAPEPPPCRLQDGDTIIFGAAVRGWGGVELIFHAAHE
jgi:pSer/pThr/pTyr-binding forkhead associated (FHA) protein